MCIRDSLQPDQRDDLSLPKSQWTPVATNVPNASGNFTITATNAVNLNVPQCFYILQIQ